MKKILTLLTLALAMTLALPTTAASMPNAPTN